MSDLKSALLKKPGQIPPKDIKDINVSVLGRITWKEPILSRCFAVFLEKVMTSLWYPLQKTPKLMRQSHGAQRAGFSSCSAS